MFCAKIASWNVHIEILLEKSYIDIIKSVYMNLHEFICCYEAEKK
jgi:hypothetical protein